MVYSVVITKRAKYLIDNVVGYLIYSLKNIQAAHRLRDNIEKTITRISENPYQFRRFISNNTYLKNDYRCAMVGDMNYILVFKIVENKVYIMGIFHCKEEFQSKIE